MVWLTAAGILIGAPLASALGRAAESLLFEVQPFDTGVMAGAILTLAVVSLLAGFLPARRATRLDPIRALRHE